MTPRLTTDFWVSAYRQRLSLQNIPAFITARGDMTAGAVLVKLNTLDGQAKLFHRAMVTPDRLVWEIMLTGDEAEIDRTIARQKSFDPDLWVIEVESREGVHLLDQDGLN